MADSNTPILTLDNWKIWSDHWILRLSSKKKYIDFHERIVASISLGAAGCFKADDPLRVKWKKLKEQGSSNQDEAIFAALGSLLMIKFEKNDTTMTFITRFRSSFVFFNNLSPGKLDDKTAIRIICKAIPEESHSWHALKGR
ncbi:hypothetical protein ACJ73_00415 [Blastomyces percursus]|uniref:Uncharacterized protein n=1 Tax=Blastomyces percursus TaxID=1658174 RepID=A0A1J9QJB5_9EURO|nr:hypothetical protein ACJ73_00415 [Blastomyces percursus]